MNRQTVLFVLLLAGLLGLPQVAAWSENPLGLPYLPVHAVSDGDPDDLAYGSSPSGGASPSLSAPDADAPAPGFSSPAALGACPPPAETGRGPAPSPGLNSAWRLELLRSLILFTIRR